MIFQKPGPASSQTKCNTLLRGCWNERCEIARRRQAGQSIRQIAAMLKEQLQTGRAALSRLRGLAFPASRAANRRACLSRLLALQWASCRRGAADCCRSHSRCRRTGPFPDWEHTRRASKRRLQRGRAFSLVATPRGTLRTLFYHITRLSRQLVERLELDDRRAVVGAHPEGHRRGRRQDRDLGAVQERAERRAAQRVSYRG
jgi:hypothetical protein